MTALVTLLVVLLLSLLVTRVATVALSLTGLSREAARFQARSAFTGSGFTTSESELVVNHPVRRRIVMWLMLLGNAGVVAVLGSFLLTFIDATDANWPLRIAVLIGGFVGLWAVASSRLVDRIVSRLTTAALKRWTRIDVADYAELLHLAGAYRVIQLTVDPRSTLVNVELADLRRRGVVVLGVERADGDFDGVPALDIRVAAGDRLTLYGHADRLRGLDDVPPDA